MYETSMNQRSALAKINNTQEHDYREFVA